MSKSVTLLDFVLWTEQIEGKGEDAQPSLLIGNDDTGILAVFDGMGGAGSTQYAVEENVGQIQEYSGAYLASRLAKDTLENFYIHTPSDEQFVENLETYLQTAFQTYSARLNPNPSKLKSKLLRQLPTTLAGIYYQINSKQKIVHLQSFWAGDSRCYLLTPEKGLQQISKDDLNGNPDAFESLFSDAIITNCISASPPFELHHLSFNHPFPLVLLTASDGCFGYLPSPIHLEYFLLKSLTESHFDMEDWRERLTDLLVQFAGDDMSMSLLALGFRNLNHLKHSFYKRYQTIYQDYIKILQENEPNPTLLQNLWERYKISYYLRM